MVMIRPATINDATAIADIHKAAFQEDVSTTQVELGLKEEHHTFVAVADSKIVGFTDSFLTTSLAGERRLELDLLAVHPEYHGQGIGKRLIRAVTELSLGQKFVRALVAAENIAMQHTIPKLGYQSNMEIFALYISSGAADEAPLTADAHLIPITTLSYSGYWLEGIISPQAIDAALSKRKGDEIVGCVVPASNTIATANLQDADFSYIKDFHWWIKAT